MAESEEELKSILMKVKEESEKVGLKLKIQKTKNMSSGSITSWPIDGEKVEIVTDLLSWALKSLWMVTTVTKLKHLFLERNAMTNLGNILKSRDITLSTKVHIVRIMIFLVVMYGCESWTIKKVEHWRSDAFELWCWRRLLRVPWTARKSNQSILKEISPEYSLEGLMQKLRYFGHLMRRKTYWKRPWCWEKLRAGGERDDRGWDGWMASGTQWAWVWANSGR